MKFHLIVAVIFWGSVNSNAQDIDWQMGDDVVSISKHVSILEDKHSSMDINAVSSNKYRQHFALSNQSVIHLGFTESVYWFRFELTNNTTDSLWLELEHAFIPEAELYMRNVTGGWVQYKSGYKISLYEKIVKNHFQVFPLLPGTNEYYIRLIPLVHPIPIKIWRSEVYQVKANQQEMTYGIYCGILFFAIAINIFLFLAFRKLYYLQYAILIFLYICSSAAVLEGFFIYFFPRFDLMYGYKVIPVLDMPALLLYCVTFLEFKKFAPRLYKFTLFVCVLLILYIVALHFLPLMFVLSLNYVLALLVFIFAIYIGIMIGRKGNKMGYYFVMAYSIWFILLLLEELYIQTGMPAHIFDLSYVSIAIFIESLLLAFLLVKRFQWDKKENERARLELQRSIVMMQAKFEQEILQTQLEIQEQTFNRVSQEIHDNIGQTLTLAKLNLNLYANESGLPEQDIEKISVTKGLITNVIRELRDISKAMNTDFIRSAGLTEAIAQQIDILRRTGAFEIKFVTNGNIERYDINKELFAFRIVQELLNNIIKHAEATLIQIQINYKPGQLEIKISDNGKGFDLREFEDNKTKGMGLYNIKDRVKLLNGQVTIISKLNVGTDVVFSIPQ